MGFVDLLRSILLFCVCLWVFLLSKNGLKYGDDGEPMIYLIYTAKIHIQHFLAGFYKFLIIIVIIKWILSFVCLCVMDMISLRKYMLPFAFFCQSCLTMIESIIPISNTNEVQILQGVWLIRRVISPLSLFLISLYTVKYTRRRYVYSLRVVSMMRTRITCLLNTNNHDDYIFVCFLISLLNS